MNRTTYRLAAGTLLAGGIWLALSAADEPAHAADTRPTAEQPGGLLGHVLPTQAADRAREAVEDGVDKPEPTEPPADEPPVEDKPRDEPAPPAEPAPTIPAPTLPPVDVPPVIIDPPITDPIEVDLPPIETPTPPAEQPTEQPPLVTLPPTSDPVQVEVLTPIGPVPATQLPLDGVPLELHPRGIRAAETPVCEDEPAPEPDYVRRILDRITGLAAAKPSRPYKPCPGHDIPPNVTNAATPAVKPPGGYGADLVGDGRGGLHHPTPALLRHCWPRCHLPGGRTEHPEPGPA